MKKFSKILVLVTACALLMAAVLTGCAKETTDPETTPSAAPTPAAPTPAPTPESLGDISVISREEGSGTRGAFIELVGIQDENKVDRTTVEAAITNDTAVMLTSVAGNPAAIGYISLGSLNDSVKALKVEGTEATVENILAKTYKISRPFNIATKGAPSATAQDFINFILSPDGQKIVTDNKYISESQGPAYAASGAKGKIVVAGSSSVTPLMEKLAEAYMAINKDVTIEVQQSDSSTGMKSAIEGICDIGMASRELKESELAELTPIVIAMDGIAVIVNNENPIDNITADQIRDIFIGEITSWDAVK